MKVGYKALLEAAERLGVQFLRDLDESALPRIAQLEPTLARRARHIVTEHGISYFASDPLAPGSPHPRQ